MLFGNSVLYISPKRKYSYHLLVKYNKKTQKMYVFFIHAFILALTIEFANSTIFIYNRNYLFTANFQKLTVKAVQYLEKTYKEMRILMNQYELISPCHFGLEAVLKKEIQRLGYQILKTEDGKITFSGGSDAICRSNIFLRTTERILLKTGSFHAATFDELFEGTKAIPWETKYPDLGKIPICRKEKRLAA